MTELLRYVLAEIEKLTEEEQNAIASRLLAELENERKWKSRFEATNERQWNALAKMVRQDIAAGNINSIDDVFSSEQ
ncbi:hypothetical protein [Laspinema olomoucense]|uniref:Addiction module component n=1 Tax=Laspinema olomoucense D3b TaxID=2953688 RepID=A0ABT2NEC5_9CYAN|nr:hypothetical protein [Laspinema sp. D3b]MCT7979596.1 hypothetical protein [Laspinema sp. D3b]